MRPALRVFMCDEELRKRCERNKRGCKNDSSTK